MARPGYASDVVAVVGERGFRRLLSLRVAGQLADGVFQVALTSYVLFSPERQANARSIAAAFAILLLPYSVIGPFAGVLIDRWRRRQTLLAANLVRAGLVVVAALVALSPAPEWALLAVGVVAISVNRLVLSALGASIPRVVPLSKVITANAIAPTVGTLATVIGAGLGYALRQAAGGGGDGSDALAMSGAAALYTCAALLALTLGRDQLGPDAAERIHDAWAALRHVVRGLGQGITVLRTTPKAIDAFVVTAAQRFCFGTATVATVLLMRNTFNPPTDPDAGLAGLATAVSVTGIGILTGALSTPLGTRRLGSRRWVPAVLAVAAAVQVALAAPVSLAPLLVGAFAIGFVAQSVKVTVDSMLQRAVDDAYLGRIFSLYDVAYNLAFVGAAVAAAFVIPTSGRSPVVFAAVAVVYAGTAVWFARRPSEQTEPQPS